MKSKAEQLFDAVRRGQTGNIQTLLSQGVNINCRSKQSGNTPLIQAAKKRNFVVQKLLLCNGANPRMKDCLGLTPLHYVAEAGDIESIKLLLAYQSPINNKDKMGCTPLHYAIDRGHISVTELLVFCGADAFSVNMTGQSPMSVSGSSYMKAILSKSEDTRNGITNGGIHIQHMELQTGSVYRLDDIDLTIYTPKSFPVTNLSFLCRRVQPEYCSNDLRAVGKEILISDTYEYIISSTHLLAIVGLDIPLYDRPDPYENVHMKTDTDTEIDPQNMIKNIRRVRDENTPGRLKWVCYTEVDITKMRSFILVTIPKVEEFPTGLEGGTFTSEIDKFVQIQVEPNTFDSGHISLEMIPSPIYKQQSYPDILAIGHFYDINQSEGFNDFEKDHVTFTVPTPHNYDGEGELCVVSARNRSSSRTGNYEGSDEDYEEIDEEMDGYEELNEEWEILSRDAKSTRGRVSSSLSHFSIHVVCEAKKDTPGKVIVDQVSGLHKKARRRDRIVKFFAMLKPMEGGIYVAVLECTSPQKIIDRMNYWKTSNYLEQDPAFTGDFETRDRLDYKVNVSGNIKVCLGADSMALQFHTKRENYQQFYLQQSDSAGPGLGLLGISEKDGPSVTSVCIYLKGTPTSNEDRQTTGAGGFTQDNFIREIAVKLGPEWIHVAILLGLTIETVDRFRSKQTSAKNTVEKKCFKTLQFWRDKCESRQDKGIPDLFSALKRVGKIDVAEFVLAQMESWYEEKKEKGEQDMFCQWIEETKSRSEGLSSLEEEVFQPMSDQFLVLLAETHGSEEFKFVGIHMDLPNNQIENIFTDYTLGTTTHKIFMVLVRAREIARDEITAYKRLLSALEAGGKMEAKEWVLEKGKEWLAKGEELQSKFYFDLKEFFKQDQDEEEEVVSENEDLDI